MNIEILLSFVLATAVLAASTGPDNLFVLAQSMVHGKKHGLATVAGLMSGCIIHTSFIAFGLSAIIKENVSVFFIIKLLGAAYLCYLAFQVFKSDSKIRISTNNVPKKTTIQLFKTGFLMNVLNPKVTFFFLAFFPEFLFSDILSTVVQFYVLGGLFIITSFIIFSSIAFLGSTLFKYLTKYKKTGVYLKWGQIIIFIGIAILVLI
ncbi:MAG: LysE family translocator [Flavobacteriaceae bacterium]|nr:MAG: LysE family translocator [Flavobacteriaceae bacterium]